MLGIYIGVMLTEMVKPSKIILLTINNSRHYFIALKEALSGRSGSRSQEISPTTCEVDLDRLVKKIASRLLPPVTSALSEKLQAAVQPVVDELHRPAELTSKNQPSATQS
ncbi:unnamed protein product [Toxocara canis]|uniref:Uncharacterized protein n=1 Tax=Toxocara canis TaxID=6265 RepID=A0A183UDN4_TOXCA|nr:unnamed protein product [Toxocara canis]